MVSVFLAVIALLAISMLVNRHRLEEVAHSLATRTGPHFLEEFPDSSTEIKSARALLLVGLAHVWTMQAHYSTIERIATLGQDVTVLLTNPNAPVIEAIASNIWGRGEAERVRSEINSSLKNLCHLRSIKAPYLHLRVSHQYLPFGVIGINPEDRDGILYVTHFSFRKRSYPKLVLHRTDEPAYGIYLETVRRLWDDAVDWNCVSGNGTRDDL